MFHSKIRCEYFWLILTMPAWPYNFFCYLMWPEWCNSAQKLLFCWNLCVKFCMKLLLPIICYFSLAEKIDARKFNIISLAYMRRNFFIVLVGRKKCNTTSRTYTKARRQWSNSLCLLPSPTLEARRRSFKLTKLHLGRK